MFAQNQEEVKLEWMYKGPTANVNREEYLLGRSIDKTIEQLNEEERQKQLALIPQPKNHVEHECIPPSIRDYKKQVGDQVDLQNKVQEDPLLAIKKHEEEKRRQFLNNPIQLKKLQKALKAQKKEKKSKKKKRKNASDSDDDLDAKLAKKLKLLKSAKLPSNSAKNESNMDIILMHKYNQLKSNLSENDIEDIFKSNLSSNSSSNDSDGSEDNSNTRKTLKNKDLDVKEKSYKTPRYSRRSRSASVESDKINTNRHYREYGTNKYNRRLESSSYDEKKKDKVKERFHGSDKHSKAKLSRSRSQEREASTDRDRNKNRRQEIFKSHVGSSRNCMNNYDRGRETHIDKQKSSNKFDKNDSRRDKYNSSDDSDSDFKNKIKNYGLVRADGTKIAFNKTTTDMPSSSQIKPKEKIETSRPQFKRQNLTEEEKERRRREMAENASWRDSERVKNVKRYREEELKEKTVQKDYDSEFIHKQLMKSAKIGTVESRIKSNINNIQRLGSDMNRHFSRR